MSPHRKLPPMASLRPFEAAARHLSFTQAAAELCVTQAAVSKQIRLLEQWLGAPLFVRRGRAVELTSAGTALYQAVSMGLSHIAETVAAIAPTHRSARYAIGMRLAFASQFLAPRIGRFRTRFPDIDFSMVTTEGNPLALLDSVDLAVVLGAEPQPGVWVEHLFDEEIFPVCSPAYLRAHPELRSVADLAGQTLLHLTHTHWRELAWDPIDWPALARALSVPGKVGYEGPFFDSHELLMSAAVSGIGVAVGWRHLCADLLERGHLVRPVAESYRIDRAHYLVGHEARRDDPVLRELAGWIVEQTAHLRDPAP